MQTAVVTLNFGEPARPDRDAVVEYLSRIFYANASLEDAATDEEAWERSRELAQRRAPGLIEEYESIGGSPLNAQAEEQRAMLEAELADRGHDATVVNAMQFTDPLVPSVAEELADAGVDAVVALPTYPLCGPSTTVAAIDELAESIAAIDGFDPAFSAVSGWHRHPTYTHIRADATADFLDDRGLAPNDPDTAFVFSAHGTPTRYLEAGSRYDTYVEEYCATIAAVLGLDDYHLGYQNHANRDIPWTEPEVEDVVENLDGREHVIVEPTSFLHEQSETLAELDEDLRGDAEAVGLSFHRVPVPHDDPRIGELFADLVEPLLVGADPAYYHLRQCVCRSEPDTYCLNAPY